MVSGEALQVGQTVHVLGNPVGLRDVYTRGLISKVEDGFAFLNVQIAPGNSGGPVCDDRGEVIGITTAKHEGANLGIAISTESAWRLINMVQGLELR